MRKLYSTLLILFIFSFAVQAQWTATSGPYGGNISNLRRSASGTLYAVINQRLFQSTNNGDTWTQISTSLYLNDLLIDTDGKMYAVYYSTLYVSSDAGTTWTILASNLFQSGLCITKVGPDGVFAVWGYSGAYVSTNKGVSWVKISSLQAGNSNSFSQQLVANAAGDIYYVVNGAGTGSKIWKHPYGGTSNWKEANMVQTNFSLAGIYDTVGGMAFSATGTLYVSSTSDFWTSDGTTFTSIKAGLSAGNYNGPLAFAPDGVTLYFYSNNDFKLYKSTAPTTLPTSWTNVAGPTANYGSPVNNVIIAPALTFFVGTGGDGVFRSSDSGATWLFKSVGMTTGTGYEIEVTNTNKIIVIKNARSYWSSTDGGATYTIGTLTDYVSHVIKLSDGTILMYGSKVFRSTDNGATFTGSTLYYYHAKIMEASNGDLYATANNTITKSIDKGVTWTDLGVTGLPVGFSPYGAAIDATTNIIVNGYDFSSSTYKTFKIVGTVATLLTTPKVDTYFSTNSVFFQNNKFYLVQNSAFFYTADLGTTWTSVGFSGNSVFPLKNSSYSGIGVSKNGSFYVSQDNGGSWNNSALPNSNSYINDIAVDASGNFFASGNSTPVLKNTSQLLVNPSTLPPYINFNWQPLNGPYGGSVQKVEIHPDGVTLAAAANNTFWRYNGTKWIAVDPTGTNAMVSDIEIDVAGNMYALSRPSKIYKSIDKGITWNLLPNSGIPSTANFTKIEIMPDGSILLFGIDTGLSRIYKSTNGGSVFSNVFNGSLSASWRIPVVRPGATGVIAAFNRGDGLIVSTNSGTSWTIKSLSTLLDLVKGSFGNMTYDKDGNLLVTTLFDASVLTNRVVNVAKSPDNGATWVKLTTPSTEYAPTNVYTKRIVALGTGEYLLTMNGLYDSYRSTDGGANWAPTGNIGDALIYAVTKGTTSYMFGTSDGGILKTTDGGLTYITSSNGIPPSYSSNEIRLLNNKDLIVGASRPFYSSDFGQNFSISSMRGVKSFLQVKDSLIGYGSYSLLKSKDSGKTWIPFGVSNKYFAYLTVDATGNGYYASDGQLLSYSTDLVNWTDISLTGLPASLNYSINSLVITSGGIIYAEVTNFDTNVEEVYKIVFGSAINISSSIGTTYPTNLLYVNNKIYLYDATGIIYKSTDGDVWTQGPAPAGNSLVVSGNYLFIPAGGNVLWLSRDDGASWQSVGDIPLPSNSQYIDFSKIIINEYDGYAYATMFNGIAKKSGNMVMPDDKTKPVIALLSPLNSATGVVPMPVLKITFDEVTKSVAGKLVRIFDATSTTVPVAVLDMSTATQSGKTWSLATTTALAYNKSYFVVVDPGAVADIFGNQFAGISSATTWKFTTSAPPDTQAPTITFVADPVQKGAGNKVLSAIITDNVGVALAKISYRSITTNNAVTTANLTLNTTTGKYEVTIPESSFGPMGLEYFFTASDAAPNTTRSPLTGNYYSYITYPTPVNPSVTGALVGVGGKVADWRIITIPFALADNRISTVFSELGAVDNSKWRFINYKTSAAWNEYPADFSTFTQGKGYFINMTTPTSLIIEGATTPSWNKETPFIFTLSPGWNQIGNPYTYPMKWSEVLAANSSPAGIATTMKGYKGSYADAAQLEVFEGAFVLNSGTTNVTMTAPIVGSLAGGRVSSPNYDLRAGDWLVPITFKAGEIENTFGGVGMNSKASIGVDAYDDFNPPALFDFAQINFPHPEHFLKQSTRDVVPLMDEFKWEFSTATNQSGTGLLRWDNSMFSNEAKDLFLLDIALQKITNMRETNSYSFKNSESSRFKIFFGSDLKDSVKPERISLGDAYPNPTTGKSIIPFTLPASNGSFQVKIEMYNMMGQKVGTVVQGDFAPGFYKTEWDGSDESLTTGLYTYRLLVSDQAKSEVLNGKIVLKK